jgi:hypothetical protein
VAEFISPAAMHRQQVPRGLRPDYPGPLEG